MDLHSPLYKLQELLIIFVLYPISLVIPYPISAKLGIGALGLVYIFFVLLRIEKVKFRIKKGLSWKEFWIRSIIIFVVIAVTTTLYVWWTAPDSLFHVPRTNIQLFVFILFVYSFLSVWPQEIIYRTFFFKRYSGFFSSKKQLLFVNAVLFSIAHLVFKNTLVMVLTLIGGFLFALSFIRYKSTTLVTIEHALYGNWLFTVGMGQMLGFPGMEN